MDNNLICGTRDLALSGAFAMSAEAARLRVDRFALAAVDGWQHDAAVHLSGGGARVPATATSVLDTLPFGVRPIGTRLFGTRVNGTSVPATDRSLRSAPEPLIV